MFSRDRFIFFWGGDFGGLVLDFGFWWILWFGFCRFGQKQKKQPKREKNVDCLQGANPALPQGQGPPRGNSRDFFSSHFWSLFQVFGRRNVYGSNFAQFLGDFHLIIVIRCSLCWWICFFFEIWGLEILGSWNVGSWNVGSWNVGSWNVGSNFPTSPFHMVHRNPLSKIHSKMVASEMRGNSL